MPTPRKRRSEILRLRGKSIRYEPTNRNRTRQRHRQSDSRDRDFMPGGNGLPHFAFQVRHYWRSRLLHRICDCSEKAAFPNLTRLLFIAEITPIRISVLSVFKLSHNAPFDWDFPWKCHCVAGLRTWHTSGRAIFPAETAKQLNFVI